MNTYAGFGQLAGNIAAKAGSLKGRVMADEVLRRQEAEQQNQMAAMAALFSQTRENQLQHMRWDIGLQENQKERMIRQRQWEENQDRETKWHNEERRYREGRDAIGDQRWDKNFGLQERQLQSLDESREARAQIDALRAQLEQERTNAKLGAPLSPKDRLAQMELWDKIGGMTGSEMVPSRAGWFGGYSPGDPEAELGEIESQLQIIMSEGDANGGIVPPQLVGKVNALYARRNQLMSTIGDMSVKAKPATAEDAMRRDALRSIRAAISGKEIVGGTMNREAALASIERNRRQRLPWQ